ncbi:LysM peptidoglycan-binding domain-containing protein [Paenibacillus xylaniclasticus]|uniref:LysM peptidoglycan-binding domain-containing protein n=1 Tax=Paenibacillus xylaniclasticus TaxID=588083 RepID=UPI000FD945AF|nr:MULTISPECIES: LysM peptidoglycan-binding domain-containing protein [Paenibacillus]GFN33643.1 stage VI sporulation protein D [Paenibacillus curdlanolyticus]
MPDQSNGLRFDVYERVHLPDDVAAIEELEEIELVPRIQVVQQGEQALLEGQLLLSGVYRSQHDLQQPQNLEHWIPVEITLPMNRVHSLDDISVEIDHFDVDLLSSRTLNITGILSLHGIQADQQEAQNQAWQEEPITVVHRRESAQPAEPQPEQAFRELTETARQDGYGQAQHRAEEAAPQSVQQQSVQQPAPLHRQEEAPLPWGQPFSFQPPPQEPVQPYPFAFESGQAELQQQAPIWNSAGQPIRSESEEQPQERESHPPVINWSAFANQQPIEQPPEIANAQGRPEEQLGDLLDQTPQQLEPSVYSSSEERSALGQFGDISSHSRTDASSLQEEKEDSSASALSFASPSIQPHSEPNQQAQAAAVSSSVTPLTQQPTAASVEARQQQENEPERKEPRVAFGRKRTEEEESEGENVGLRTLLASSRREQESRETAESAQQQPVKEASRVTTGDEIEWKTLFLGKLADEQAFRRVRMCIVQREETLDDIAARYGKNSRELSLYNRLQDQALVEGQVLYIP